MLRQTSRSFYLTLRVLPRAVRPQIALAYLLARTADTVADTELVPPEQRLEALRQLRQRIRNTARPALNFTHLAAHQGTHAERKLLEQAEASLAALETLDPADARRVRDVLDIILSGQELDLQRFAEASARNVLALQTEAELDDYTWRVAGCVGEFWTRLCRAHLFPNAPLDETRLLADAVRFGKGLQLVNILRDLAADLRKGRCYLPQTELRRLELAPADLLNPDNEARLRPLYDRYLDLATAHLTAGWAYTNALPWRCARVRLACAWPILIGLRTLALLRTARVLEPTRPVKVSRAEVRRLLALSVLAYGAPAAPPRPTSER
ncbi:MAG: squalene/phytoene synthase family protein [Verrucomicrobiae bacterium]|nr:squalene/phytoene synthase family protein [Verrucomicrobiae bacterium]